MNGGDKFIKELYTKIGGREDRFDTFKDQILSNEDFRRKVYDKVGGSPDKFNEFSEQLDSYTSGRPQSQIEDSTNEFNNASASAKTRADILREEKEKLKKEISERESTDKAVEKTIDSVSNTLEDNMGFTASFLSRVGGKLFGKKSYVENKANQELKNKFANRELKIEDFTPEDLINAERGEGWLESRDKASDREEENLKDFMDEEGKIDVHDFLLSERYDAGKKGLGSYYGEKLANKIKGKQTKMLPSEILLADEIEGLSKQELVELKNAVAVADLIDRETYSDTYINYYELANQSEKQAKDNLKDELGKRDYQIYEEFLQYTMDVEEGRIERDPQKEASYGPVLQKVQNSENATAVAKIQTAKYEAAKNLSRLPRKYVDAVLAEKSNNALQKGLDREVENSNGFMKTLRGASHLTAGTLERTVEGVINLPTLGLAMLGNDAAGSELIKDATLSDKKYGYWLNGKTTKEKRPLHEYVADMSFNGNLYTLSFDKDSGEVVGIYDQDGFNADLSDKERQALIDKATENELYGKAELKRNAASTVSNAIDLAGDVLVTVGLTAGIGSALKAAGSVGGTLGRVSSAASKSDRFKTVASIMAQYQNRITLDGIRSGKLDPTEGAWYGATSSLMEAGLEAVAPLASRVGRGAGILRKASEQLSKREVLDFIKKMSTKKALGRASGSFIKALGSEMGEEFAAEILQPKLNSAFNSLMGGDFEETGMPTIEELKDIAILTSIASFLPAVIGSSQDFRSFKSDVRMTEILTKMLDPKYESAREEVLKTLVEGGKLTQEEVDNFNDLFKDLGTKIKSIDDYEKELDTAERKDIKEKIINKEIDNVSLSRQLIGDSNLDKKVQSKIDKNKADLEELYKKLDKNEFKKENPKKKAKKNKKQKQKEKEILERQQIDKNFEVGEDVDISIDGRPPIVGTITQSEETGEQFIETENGDLYTPQDLRELNATVTGQNNNSVKFTKEDPALEVSKEMDRQIADLEAQRDSELSALKEEYLERNAQGEFLLDEDGEVTTLESAQQSINNRYDNLISEKKKEKVDLENQIRKESTQDEGNISEFNSIEEAEEAGVPIKETKPFKRNSTKGKRKTYKRGGKTYTNNRGLDAIVFNKDGSIAGVSLVNTDTGNVAYIQGQPAITMAEKLMQDEINESKQSREAFDEFLAKKDSKEEIPEPQQETEGKADGGVSAKIDNSIGKKVRNKGKVKSRISKKKLKDQVSKISKALEKFIPNLEVVVLDTPQEFSKYMMKNFGESYPVNDNGKVGVSGAFGKSSSKGRVIVINAAEARSNTVYHEGSHAVLDILSIADPDIIDKFYNNLLDLVKENEAIKKYIEYGDKTDFQQEEAIVEFLADFIEGKLAPSDIGISMEEATSMIQKVKDYLSNIIKSWMGLKYTPTDTDLQSLAVYLRNTIDNKKELVDIEVSVPGETIGVTVKQQKTIEVSTTPMQDAEILDNLLGRERGQVTNTLMQRVINTRVGKSVQEITNKLNDIAKEMGAVTQEIKDNNLSSSEVLQSLSQKMKTLGKKRDDLLSELETMEGQGILDSKSFC